MESNVTIYELALGRVLDYLARHDIEVTPAVLQCAMQILTEGLAAGEKDLLQRVFDALPQCIEISVPVIPAAAPPLRRRSMGYG